MRRRSREQQACKPAPGDDLGYRTAICQRLLDPDYYKVVYDKEYTHSPKQVYMYNRYHELAETETSANWSNFLKLASNTQF